ncbi:Tubulin-tyrosine ligase family protein [Tritrichomonas foetus]|uniref:Tubulin-tyrosine ligase family protein n=1 Tax=Tritrichomonas foetus TaxID=1144522 RepID=A0A1J4KN73_9EUKA|nr:Tubulin-tyrosine ligase family protein [Tritrichomonas foetus]|eukprot:OHT11244.1 Tubulin-tyrosine ligase family protein [Tritrichomonas foetus]
MNPKNTEVEIRRLRCHIIKDTFEAQGFNISSSSSDANLVWWDGSIPLDEFSSIKPEQHVNKIPGMDVLCYKSTLFQALNQMQPLFPNYYTFFPKTFLLPHQYSEFLKEHQKLNGRHRDAPTWIVKPRAGCCGAGIRLVQIPYDLAHDTTPSIVQRYVSPFLIDSHKFDFRLYLLISSLHPFTLYIYNEGIARFCTQKYHPPTRQNLSDKFMHITNTAINAENKISKDFEYTRSASSVFEAISESDPYGAQLWEKIKKISTLTLLALYPQIVTSVASHCGKKKQEKTIEPSNDPMNRFFHILGIDIMINDQCDPMVLELNDNPSMKVGVPFEDVLKRKLLSDTLKVVTLDGSTPPNIDSTGWQKLLPVDDGTHFTTVIRTIQQRALNVFGPKTPVNSLISQQAVKSIVYPKLTQDKSKLKKPVYRYHFQ